MHIVLVNMPWALLDMPSLAVGILRRCAADAVPDASVSVVHANLDYVDWVTERRQLTLADFNFLALDSYFSGLGDWVFSSALYGDPEWRVDRMTEELTLSPQEHQLSLDLHRNAPEFIDELAGRILATKPDVVGFTSTFQQNTAALAAARAIKRMAPHVRTVFGGANCDSTQGAAMHRNFDFVDVVVRGEGEQAFPALLRLLRAGEPGPDDLAGIPGLCWRTPDGASVANPMTTRPLPPGQIVSPDYTGFYDRLASSVAHDWVEPKLVVEGSRGCWWGQKHHCTFCGLNGSFMEFRSKSPTAFFEEIVRQVAQHQVLDMYVVDNILDMGYVTSLLPRLAESGYDLRLQYEIKSNLKRDQLATLVAAGVVNVQPGIESLNSRVLTIMDKGVTGCQNVRMLRDATSVGLSASWNYLYGFPGEQAADYLPVIEQFPALHHLAPMEGVARIAIERFSPYFNRPELGFTPLQPDPQYRRNYDLAEAEMLDFGYIFAAPKQGVDDSIGELLREAGARWQSEHVGSRLSQIDLGAEIILINRRTAFSWRTLRLSDPVELAVFRLLDQPHSVAALCRKLPARADEAAVTALLDRWRQWGLVFSDGGHHVHVVPQSTNEDLLRFPRIFDSRRAALDPDPADDQPAAESQLTAAAVTGSAAA